MHVGLIVGIGPAATDLYYRSLITALAARGVDLELTMAHADAPTLLRNQASGDADAQVAIYGRLTGRLQAAGASAVAVTSIAGHFCIDAFKAVSPLRVIDMLAEVDRGVEREGLVRVGIIGTRVAMETRLYGAVRHAEVVAPPPDLLLRVHDAYAAMAIDGAVTEAQRELFFSAGRVLVEALARRRSCSAGRTWASHSRDAIRASAPSTARQYTRRRSRRSPRGGHKAVLSRPLSLRPGGLGRHREGPRCAASHRGVSSGVLLGSVVTLRRRIGTTPPRWSLAAGSGR